MPPQERKSPIACSFKRLPSSASTAFDSISERLRPALRVLQIFCYFPNTLNLSSGSIYKWRSALWALYTLLAFSLNMFILYLNYKTSRQYIGMFTIIHTFAVSSVITGVKPVLNVYGIGTFFLNVAKHKRLLRIMDVVDASFRANFDYSVKVRGYNMAMIGAAVVAFVAPFSIRMVEHNITGSKFGTNLLYDLSLIMVPLLTIWNILPLIYYEILNKIVRQWVVTLRDKIRVEVKRRNRGLQFYYDQFFQICSVQEAIGQLVNPFIFLSIGWALFNLCLSIYFITQVDKGINDPPPGATTPEHMVQWMRMVKFIAIWSVLQIVLSLVYTATICYTGTITNELTRQILNAALTPTIHVLDHWDRYQVSCFVRKMNTQYMWGMSIWRIFPLERSFFFTMVGMIVTYSFLLLRLKDNVPGDGTSRAFNSTQ